MLLRLKGEVLMDGLCMCIPPSHHPLPHPPVHIYYKFTKSNIEGQLVYIYCSLQHINEITTKAKWVRYWRVIDTSNQISF